MGVSRFSRLDGYLVYLAEAAGRERSHPNLPVNASILAFGFISASATAATFRPCPPIPPRTTLVYVVEGAARARS